MKDEWAAYQLDETVAVFGHLVENLVEQIVNVGTDQKPKWQPKYRLEDLLSPDFSLAKYEDEQVMNDLAMLGGYYDEVD